MKFRAFTIALLCGVSLFTVSCEQDEAMVVEPQESLKASSSDNMVVGEGNFALDRESLATTTLDCSYEAFTKSLSATYFNNAVEASECGPTAFNTAIRPYALQFGDREWEWYDLMTTLNQLYTYVDASDQYFGTQGQLTDFANKHFRNLESFWHMQNEITLKGQHTNTLQNREAIAAVYMNFTTLTKEQSYANADYLIANVIDSSEVFQSTPLLSFDGFATGSDLIVIGDGLVQIMTEAGVDEKVTFAGILAHEWGHQVQFNNYTKWYGPRVSTAEATRRTELEADLFSSYYMTHKRGATYNWKSAAEFFELFYNIGDCGFTLSSHHGTPNQRLAASRLGWIIAQESLPMGHIFSADELHKLFMAALNDIVDNKIDSSEALASLKTPQLKAVYGKVLKHEKELQDIANGHLDQAAILNL